MNRQKHALQTPAETPSDGQARFIRRLRRHRITVRTARILILILFLLLWEFCADQGIIDSFIFSSPSRIALCFYEMTVDRSIFLHIGITLYETIVSFLLVTAIGILAAVLLWCSRSLSEILEPYLVVLNSLPKSALAPLLIVWLGATPTTIIVAGMSVAIFGSIMNISNMKVNIGLCLVGVVIGEFLAARSGLGYLIIYSSQVFKMNWLLMSIVLLCIMAMALYAVIGVVEKLYRKRF